MIRELQFAPDEIQQLVVHDGTLVTSGTTGLRAWSLDSRESLPELLSTRLGMRIVTDGHTLVVYGMDHEPRILRFGTWESLGVIRGHTGPVRFARHITIDTSAGKGLITMAGDKTIRIWDLETKTQIRQIPAPRQYQSSGR